MDHETVGRQKACLKVAHDALAEREKALKLLDWIERDRRKDPGFAKDAICKIVFSSPAGDVLVSIRVDPYTHKALLEQHAQHEGDVARQALAGWKVL